MHKGARADEFASRKRRHQRSANLQRGGSARACGVRWCCPFARTEERTLHLSVRQGACRAFVIWPIRPHSRSLQIRVRIRFDLIRRANGVQSKTTVVTGHLVNVFVQDLQALLARPSRLEPDQSAQRLESYAHGSVGVNGVADALDDLASRPDRNRGADVSVRLRSKD
jgi:hypothetical protein